MRRGQAPSSERAASAQLGINTHPLRRWSPHGASARWPPTSALVRRREGANALRCLQMALAIRRSGAMIRAPGFPSCPMVCTRRKSCCAHPATATASRAPLPAMRVIPSRWLKPKTARYYFVPPYVPRISPVWGTHSQMSFKLHCYLNVCIDYQSWLLRAPHIPEKRVAMAVYFFLEKRADRSRLAQPMRGCICVTPDRARQTHGRG